jgi:aspartate ammonia-lyase
MAKPDFRNENDLLGAMQIPADALAGIHTARAVENFGPIGGSVNQRLLKAYGLVKLACVRTNAALGYISKEKFIAIEQACTELAEGRLKSEVQLAALQGGAGTSTNMYVNELIANKALTIIGKRPGEYQFISPLDDVNLHQSTNDTYPTALRVAAIFAYRELEQEVSKLVDEFQKREKEFADVVKLARTQLQDAVLITAGREMGAYAEALSRDRWRIYKCEERLRVINLGGTAVGTGLGAPQKYIFMAAEELRQITGLGLARAENLVQSTQHCDEFVEVSGILKALATTLYKVSSDLRLLSSGPQGGIGEYVLPPRQAGSSIMPGKVNPVIPELVGMAAMQAIAHDTAITLAAMNGQLELNAFLPLIAHNLLSMLDELIIACEKFRTLCIAGLQVNRENCKKHLESSTAVITAFVHKLGYEKASAVAKKAVEQKKTVKQILLEEKLCTEDEYNALTIAEAVMALGFK